MEKNKSYDWLISAEQSEKLRELGFDENNEQIVKLFEKSSGLIIEPSLETNETTYYKDYLENPDKYIPLYTYEQVLSWFRNKDLFVYVDKLTLAKNKEIYKFYVKGVYVKGISNIISDGFSSYEEARRALINKLIELYGSNKNK